jgi:phospholipid/cholesterol/gamma-HCH transport system permease protein
MGVVLRFGYAPLRGFIETIGAIVLLLRRPVVSALTPPFNYGPELVDQFLFALRLGWFPMILASLAFTYEPAGIEGGNFLNHYPTGTRSRCPTPATAATADCSASSSSAT